jgi:hypothetical protein
LDLKLDKQTHKELEKIFLDIDGEGRLEIDGLIRDTNLAEVLKIMKSRLMRMMQPDMYLKSQSSHENLKFEYIMLASEISVGSECRELARKINDDIIQTICKSIDLLIFKTSMFIKLDRLRELYVTIMEIDRTAYLLPKCIE